MKIHKLIGSTLLIVLTTTFIWGQSQVTVDFSASKSYGNISSLDRAKFFNMHATANSFNQEELSYLQKLDVGFGRSFGAPTVGNKSIQGLMSKEQHMKNIQKSRSNYLKYKHSPINLSRDLIYTSHPTSEHGNYGFEWKGLNADYTKEVDYVVTEFKELYGKKEDGEVPLPKFYEPLNEPFVHTTDIKGAKAEDVRLEMSRFHKALAIGLHKEVPELKIGGFSSAWPSVELWDFRHWEERMKLFMDVAGAEMDFLSYHIYDGKNVTGGDSFRTGSNAEAIMDLVDAYGAIKWGQPKPIVFSEHGMTRPDWQGTPYSELRDWKNIRSYNHQIMQFMDRPDQILKVVSFITGKAEWFKTPGNDPYPWVILRKVNGKYEWTHLIKLYEFWKDVKGNYTDIQSSDPDVLTHAFVDNNKAYIVLSNLELHESKVDLNFKNLPNVKSLKIRRLFLANGKPNLETESISTDTKELALRKDEAVILEYTFKKKLKQNKHLTLTNYYASEYLKPIEDKKPIAFEMNKVKPNVERASLKLGIARPLDKSLQANLTFNGQKIDFPIDWKGYDQADRIKTGFFGVIEVNIPSEMIKENNFIKLTFNENGGRVSSVKLSVLNN
ncbi:hypothetical protein [Labilibaculum antarcticum]|uniref:Beta-agarase n=1 Tax=Labilibaculum antarcticum TaxID=1717717 RepID=A0A1Y1CEL4_9BACT|nr:hypothetical protein [Labilibaculum antarcticum]BAX78462.1 hypothetical protein ALGA_0067 [Labilibaculum antarcticum]